MEKYFEDENKNDESTIVIKNNLDLRVYWAKNRYKKDFEEKKVLEYLNRNENNEELIIDAVRSYLFDLAKFIFENTLIKELPKKYRFSEKYADEFDHFECGFYGLLCYILNEEQLNEYQKDSCYDFIRFLNNKGFETNESDFKVIITDGYREGIRDYTSYLNRILNKISKLTLAYKVLDSVDDIAKEDKTLIYRHSFTAMHGIDEELKITQVKSEWYDELKNEETSVQTSYPTGIKKIKSRLDDLNFKDYIIYHNLIIVRNLFIEEGDFSLEFTSMTEW